MSKRLLSLILAIAMLLSLLPTIAVASDEQDFDAVQLAAELSAGDSFTVGGIAYQIKSDGTVKMSTTDDPIATSNVTIPASVNGYAVTEIGDMAFDGCENLKSVTMADSITTISADAFRSCSSLETVVFSNSLTTIGDGAFDSCTSLKNIMLPNSLSTIEGNAFFGCNLGHIIIPESMTEVSGFGYSGVTSVELHDGVTEITDHAFWECLFTSIEIPKSVTYIGLDAFYSVDTVYYAGSEEEWNALMAASTDPNGLEDVTVHFTEVDPGNAGVVCEYVTSFKALSGDKLPATTDLNLYTTGTYSRNGTVIQNPSLMNRNATSTLDADGNTVEEWGLMNFEITDPWDLAYYQNSGLNISDSSGLTTSYRASKYGTSEGDFIALRVNVPNKGIYKLAVKTTNSSYGIAPAVHFFRDDGTVTESSQLISMLNEANYVAHHDSSDMDATGYKTLGRVEVEEKGEYFVVFYGDDQSLEINGVLPSNGRQYLYLNGMRLSALPGDLDNVELEIETLDKEAYPMPLYTQKQILYTLLDANGTIIDEIDESKLSVSYKSSNNTVATVDANGLITARGNGSTNITVSVTYDGVTVEKVWHLTVAPVGRNLMSDRNPGFETDEWVWSTANQPEEPATAQFMRTYIGDAPSEDDADNRALIVSFDGSVAANSYPATISLNTSGARIPVKPGSLYQLSFKIKADYAVPQNASDMSMFFDIYAYNKALGTSSSYIAYNSSRNFNFATTANWRELCEDWYEVIVPIAAPTECDYDTVYLTPRLAIRPQSADLSKAGFDGTIMFDDFELREVGYAGVEVEVTSSTNGDSDTAKMLAKPYASTGTYISLGGEWSPSDAEFSSDDGYIIDDFRGLKLVQSFSGNGLYQLSTTANLGGKNGTANVTSKITINGITKTGKCEVTTSGFPMKLLYSDAAAKASQLEVGETTSIILMGYMSDGSFANLAEATVTYRSLTPDIVSVDASGKVAAERAGNGKIAVQISLDGVGVSNVIDITVTDPTPLAYATLSGPETVGYLRDAKLVLTGMMESGYAADIENAEVEWVIACSPAGAVTIDENGIIFGEVFGGTAEIYANVTINGNTVSTNSISLSVVESDLRDAIIDFKNIPEYQVQDVTVEEYGWEINFDKSHSAVASSSLTSNGLQATTNGAGRDLVLDVNVPYTGVYQLVLSAYSNGASAQLSEVYIDDIFAGEYEFYTGSSEYTTPGRLRTMYLDAGIHQITFRPTAIGPRNAYQYISTIRFAAVSELPKIAALETARDVYEMSIGDTASIDAKLITTDGFKYAWQKTANGAEDAMAYVRYSSDNEDIAIIDTEGNITAVSEGEAVIYIEAGNNEESIQKEIPVIVGEAPEADTSKLAYVAITAPSYAMSVNSAGMTLGLRAFRESGNEAELSEASVVWESSDENVATVDAEGHITPVSIGDVIISVEVTLDGYTVEARRDFIVAEGKNSRSYYTDEKVAAAYENIAKYDWAAKIANSAINKAEKYTAYDLEAIWNVVPGEGIPRSNGVGLREDPEMDYCRYCGTNLYAQYKNEGYTVDPFNRPWKVQCKSCKRIFPSNDFASFYELGRDEHGIYNRELAHKRNEQFVEETNGEVDYLKNILYPELYDQSSPLCNKDPRTGDPIDGTKWGVDDGYGYDTGRLAGNGALKEVHTYIPYYMFHVWDDITEMAQALSDAYVYTGDSKYGRVGAVLLDRVADVLPDYDSRRYGTTYAISDGGTGSGLLQGSIWDCEIVRTFALAYDSFFPIYDDPEVISFLAHKAAEYALENPKTSGEKIRANAEDGILRRIFNAAQGAQIRGNFGMHQSAVAAAAVVLDSSPESQVMIDWIFDYSETDSRTYNTGGGVANNLVNNVSRDGQGTESAPGYNRIWVTQLSDLADTLLGYDKYEGADLYQHPKYLGMIKSYAPLTLVRRGLAPIGDSGNVGGLSRLPDSDSVMLNAFRATGDIEIAQHLYFVKGGKLSDIHYDIFTKDPERVREEIVNIIEEYGEYNYDESTMLSGYGFAALRAGTLLKGNAVMPDNQRDFWIYFGGAQSHYHYDTLNLGIEAYGVPMTSDLGYPEATGSDPNRRQWQNATISHNTVVVNEQSQIKNRYTNRPLHFDTTDSRVKVMDVDASSSYAVTDEYRRTVVMVDFDSEVSYGIDFFKVRGGSDHLYSFHALSEEAPEVSDNLTFVQQVGGSYAGADVPFGNDPWTNVENSYATLKYPIGYTWLYNIRRADNPGEREFWVDFKIKDVRGYSRNTDVNHRLRMTAVNDWNADEVTLANGLPPRTSSNLPYIDHLEYMLVRRKGNNLNTLFTTVIEPYNKERYIKNIESVPVTIESGAEGSYDEVKAVKVSLVDGRVDYVVYAQNNNVTYRIDDLFDFRGFVGVYTVNVDGENIYKYVNDGDVIGEETGVPNSYTGTIRDFTRELSFENSITVRLDSEVDPSSLIGHMINVERDGTGNSAYVIKNVERRGSDEFVLGIGNVTLIDSFIDDFNMDKGYNYDIAAGQSFVIPMSYEENNAPEFEWIGDVDAYVGVENTVNVTAHSPLEGRKIAYTARQLPEGAALDSINGALVWKPDASQMGVHAVQIDAVDEGGRRSTLSFTVNVQEAPDEIDISVSAGGSKRIRLGETIPLYVRGVAIDGTEHELEGAQITVESLTPEYARVDDALNITSVSEGIAAFFVKVVKGEQTFEKEFEIPVVKVKSAATYMTAEKVAAVRENASKYAWVKADADAYINAAEKYVDNIDKLYSLIPHEGMPRSQTVGLRSDPDAYRCRYCGTDLQMAYGAYSWVVNPLVRPWKIQCPDCKRIFPSNDFALLYERGLDENGVYDRDRAVEANRIAVENGEKDALYNELYPELYSPNSSLCNLDPYTRTEIDGIMWGVDDGFGYNTGRTTMNGVEEIHTYIAYYQHFGLWYNEGVIKDAVEKSAKAYLYSGDERYGRVAAILLDRIADVYPGYDLSIYNVNNSSIYSNSHGGRNTGKLVGAIWETQIAKTFAESYDIVYDMYDDEYVVEFLKQKAYSRDTSNDKSSPSLIRENIESGILKEIFTAAKNNSISGNFGAYQSTVATAAVVLDGGKDSREMLDWLFAPNKTESKIIDGKRQYNVTGGGIAEMLVDKVDSDGMGTDSVPGYDCMFVTNMIDSAKVLSGWDEYDLFKHPKYSQLFSAQLPLILVKSHTAQIGDSGSTAGLKIEGNLNTSIEGFKHLKNTPLGESLAKYIYMLNGNSVEGLHYDATTENPESIQNEISAIIDAVGTEQKSEVLSDYGFAVLRRGREKEELRDFWLGFTTNKPSHSHNDVMNLGIEAFGLNLSPDLGYPAATNYDPNRLQWVKTTLSHNTVLIDEKEQTAVETNAYVEYFDSADKVQVVEVSAPEVYDNADEYRRTVVMVDVDKNVSYGVDFFRVVGGNQHTYSFHAQSDEVSSVEGLELVKQADESGNYIGSYAGADVPYGQDPNSPYASKYETVYPRGYTWLENVERASNPDKEFSVDFAIKDYNNAISDSADIHLRVTQVNDFAADEVAVMDGYAPQSSNNENVKTLKYMLVQHKGENLDSLFTTVYEPYKANRYIESIENAEVTPSDGAPVGETVKAVKVRKTNGITDYIVYSMDDGSVYNVDGLFDFIGRIGVFSFDASGECVYSYCSKPELYAEVVDFSKEFTSENYVEVSFDDEVDTDILAGKNVHIIGEKEMVVRRIEKATREANGNVRLDVGTRTFIDCYVDSANPDSGYEYNIACGDSAYIVMSEEESSAPVFDMIENSIAFAENEVQIHVHAESPIGSTVIYAPEKLPDGAEFDAGTGTFTWTPSADQAGNNVVVITAADASGKVSTCEFTINVIAFKDSTVYYNGENQTLDILGDTSDITVAYAYYQNGKEVSDASNVGEYMVVAAAQLPDSMKMFNAKLTVLPAPITVKANDVTMTRGDEMPELTWNVTAGELYGDDSLDGELTANMDSYQIEQGTLSNSNYDITFVPGKLTVYGNVPEPEMKDPPQIKEDEESGDKYIEVKEDDEKIRFDINLDAPEKIEGSVLAAVYNERGILLEIRRFKASEVLEIMLDRTDGKYIRIFWWSDNNMKPHIRGKKYGIR